MNNSKLKIIAELVRRDILKMSLRAQSAHTGGALSVVEILVSLYFKVMKVFPDDPYNVDRDRLIFSKAHDGKALFAVLAERGYFNRSILDGYEMNGGSLPGHSTRHCAPGVEVSAGSLGHGLSIAAGISYIGKLDDKGFKVFCILSDGECDEGSTWEAILFAGHQKLNNLITIVDYNKLQGFGFTKDILNLEPFEQKWKAFGWSTNVIDGHNFSEINTALRKAISHTKKPTVIIANTVKGIGGVKKHINKVSSQYKPPTKEEFDQIFFENDIKV